MRAQTHLDRVATLPDWTAHLDTNVKIKVKVHTHVNQYVKQ